MGVIAALDRTIVALARGVVWDSNDACSDGKDKGRHANEHDGVDAGNDERTSTSEHERKKTLQSGGTTSSSSVILYPSGSVV